MQTYNIDTIISSHSNMNNTQNKINDYGSTELVTKPTEQNKNHISNRIKMNIDFY